MTWLSHYLYFFLFFSFLIYDYKVERGKVSCDFVTGHSHSRSHDESNIRTMGE